MITSSESSHLHIILLIENKRQVMIVFLLDDWNEMMKFLILKQLLSSEKKVYIWYLKWWFSFIFLRRLRRVEMLENIISLSTQSFLKL